MVGHLGIKFNNAAVQFYSLDTGQSVSQRVDDEPQSAQKWLSSLYDWVVEVKLFYETSVMLIKS